MGEGTRSPCTAFTFSGHRPLWSAVLLLPHIVLAGAPELPLEECWLSGSNTFFLLGSFDMATETAVSSLDNSHSPTFETQLGCELIWVEITVLPQDKFSNTSPTEE